MRETKDVRHTGGTLHRRALLAASLITARAARRFPAWTRRRP